MNTGLVSSNTAILVEVDPGLMANTNIEFINCKNKYFQVAAGRYFLQF
jgi:hypothetical protein